MIPAFSGYKFVRRVNFSAYTVKKKALWKGRRVETDAWVSQMSLTSKSGNNLRMYLSTISFWVNVDRKNHIHNGKRFSV
jgi:hypothetical protein